MLRVGRPLFLSIGVAAIVASFAIASVGTVAQGPPETPQRVWPTHAASSQAENGISIIIEWDVVADADEYEVRWTRDGEEERAIVPQRVVYDYPTRDYWLPDPEPGIYHFAVRARNALGASEWSNTILHHVRETPEPPQVVVDGTDLVISWYHPASAASFELCVIREYSGCNESSSFTNLTEATLRIPEARPGEYQVTVREAGAWLAGWLSDWSPWAFIVVPDLGQAVADPTDETHEADLWRPEPIPLGTLDGPQNLRARLNGSRLYFEWDALPGADGYYLAQERPEAGWWRTRVPHKTLQGLPAGTHYFHVLARESSEDGGFWTGQWSDELAVVVPEMHSRGLAASAVETEPSRDGRPYWLATAEWRGVPGAERYQVQWRELRPRLTVTKPVILATPTQQGEQSTFTAQLRTRHPSTLQISLRAQINGEWTTWTEWLNLNAELRESATGE